jgi:uncharacterized protein
VTIGSGAPAGRRWAGIGLAVAGATVAAGAAGLPAPALFAALAIGVLYALLGGHELTMPKPAATAAQALIGVALGSEMQSDTLRAIAGDWLGVLIVIVGTVLFSVAAGLVIAAATGTSRETGMLGLVAGGASVIISMANELGADGRLVAFMQYLRVLVIVALAPMVAYFVLYDGSAPVHTPVVGAAPAGFARDLAFTTGCALAGLLAARLLRVTAGALLGPLLLAAAISISGLAGGASVPEFLELLAFAVIGLQVGLRFTYATIFEARRMLAPVLLAILALVLACAVLALLLEAMANVTFADAYLATTPGGLYAVLAASIGIGADTTFVVSVQVLRVFVIVLAAPPLIRFLARGTQPIDETGR